MSSPGPGRCWVLIWSVVACLIVISAVRPTLGGEPGRSSRAIVRAGCPDLADLIEDLAPVVVNISIEKHMLQHTAAGPPPLFRVPNGWRQDGLKDSDRYQTDSIGSGFIYDSSGLIITNRHVVEGATKILTTLSNGRTYIAKVVGLHPKADLALVKIKTNAPLKAARLADSSRVRVGEYVLAVGNPFGLGRTVTFGIVSGKGRFIGLGADDDFIQTDASINPGNSGGPLFNMAGEVIGINTAIIASGKGIGFSIPSNNIRELVRTSERTRTPTRGWIGLFVEDMSQAQARALGMSEPRGTFVDEVLDSAPASVSGILKGDLILDAGGQQVRNGRQLSRIVAGSAPGETIKMTVLRGGRSISFDIRVGEAPQ